MATTEGWVWEVKSKNLHKKIAPRYLVLQGKHFLLYREKPETGKEVVRKFGVLCNETRVEDQGREKVKGHALYVFKIYMPSRSSKGIKLGVSTPEDQAKWISGVLSHINEVVGEMESSEENVSDRSNGVHRSDSDNSLYSQDGVTPVIRRYHSIGPEGCPSLFSDISEQHKPLHWQNVSYAEDHHKDSSSSPDYDTDWQMVNEENGVRVYQYGRDKSDRSDKSDGGSPEGKHRSGPAIMKAISVVEAATEDIFTEIMDLGPSRTRWDTTFRAGSVVEVSDGHTDVIHEVLQKLWNKRARDFCLLRYWRRRENGSYDIFLCSTNHPACPANSQCVRAKLISAAYVISPMKPAAGSGIPRSLVEHTIEMDSHGWSGLLQKISNHHSKLRDLMLKRVAGLLELFRARREELLRHVSSNGSLSSPSEGSRTSMQCRTMRLPVPDPASLGSGTMFLSLDGSVDFQYGGGEAAAEDDGDDDDEDFFDCEEDACCRPDLVETDIQQQPTGVSAPSSPRKVTFKVGKISMKGPLASRFGSGGSKSGRSSPASSRESNSTAPGAAEYPNGSVAPELNLSTISGSFARVDLETGKNGWSQPPGHLFKLRAKGYFITKDKVAGGDPLLTAVAVDWYKSDSRMDNVVGQPNNRVRLAVEAASVGLSYQPLIFVVNLQIPGKTHYSAVAYYVCRKPVESGSMLHQFITQDDRFRNNRLKMIPRVHQGPWIVKQSVGDVACLLGKSLVITYHIGQNYIELDIDIGSSMVASGILRIALSYVNSYMIDLAFLVQAELAYELPEELFGTLRIARAELSSAVQYPYAPSS